MTRAEIRAAVLAGLRESAAPVRWTIDEVNRYIDDAYQEVAESSGAVVRTDTLVLAASNNFLALPTDCLFPIAARDVSTGLPIDPVSWVFIDQEDWSWIRRESTRPDVFAGWGLHEILFYPKTKANRDIALTMSVLPGPLGDDDEPDFPPDHHHALVHYAWGKALAKQADGPKLGRAMRQFGYYQEALGGLEQWSNDRHAGIATDIYSEPHRKAAIY